MNVKVNVSKPSFNVLTETNPDNLIFSSDYNTLKYYTAGTGSISGTSNGTTIVNTQIPINHALGYIPFFEVFAGNSGTVGNNVPLNETTAGVTRYVSAFGDATNIYVNLTTNNNGALTYFYEYKIFRNNLGL